MAVFLGGKWKDCQPRQAKPRKYRGVHTQYLILRQKMSEVSCLIVIF